MENNDSPYVYEKPLRSEKSKRSKRLAGFSTLGLVGFVGIFGGTAVANTVIASSKADLETGFDSANVAIISPDGTAPIADPAVVAASIEAAGASDLALISVPLQETKPKSNSVKIELPSLPSQSYGNTSSATPSAGSNNNGSVAGSAFGQASERADHEDREGHDDDD